MKDKNKLIVLVSGIVVILLMVAGISFAIFRFGETSTNQELVLGDIWMKYTESNGISLENALPGDEYTNYFEFTITGTNTYTKKDIFYDISLIHGDTPAGKTEDNRVEDKYLKFKLTEVVGNTETEIFTDKTYEDLNNKRVHVDTISKSTNTFSKTYRLYMVISEELTYGNSSDAILSTEEFGKIFGSIKVNVTGDFNEKELNNDSQSTPLLTTFRGVLETRTNSYIEDTDGTIYISGTIDDNDSTTTNDIDFNYVWYSGKLWRITAIYPDGRIKMITDDVITTLNWGEKSTVSSSNLTSSYSTSYIREWLNQEFLPTLYNYENIIDVNAGWYSITDSATTPTKPTGDYTLTDPVGLLNTYEYYMSYKNTSYSSGYLNLGYSWWLITPSSSSNVWYVSNHGYLKSDLSSSFLHVYGVRPSINLKSTIEFKIGKGTKEEPYIIKDNQEEISPNSTVINARQSGEYVKIESDTKNQVFRIVDKETIGEKLTTKIVLSDYVKESNIVLKKSFSIKSLWNNFDKTNPENWRGYLNTTWLENFDINMLEKGIYYLGYYEEGSYKTTVCSVVNSDVSVKGCIENGTIVTDIINDDYVGLLRVGEMFASQLGSRTDASTSMLLITKYTRTDFRYMDNNGNCNIAYGDEGGSNFLFTTRPTIHLKDTIVIKSGSGTKQDPFVVGLPEDFGDEGQ